MANHAKRELMRVQLSVRKAAEECEYDEATMLNWPKWPYVLKTANNEDVCVLDDDGHKRLMLFITEDEAMQTAVIYEMKTKETVKVVQPQHFYKFDTDCVLTIKNCGFEMWYGTYKSKTIIDEVKAMKATGLL